MALSLQHDEAALIREYFQAHPRQGMMIDVGAQFGTSFRPYLNDGWRIIAFEPDPSKMEKLEKYLSNPLFKLHRVAVADREREDVTFYTSEESTGISSLIPFRESHKEAARVKVTTLARVLENAPIDWLDYLKIDTEGADYRVLQGFPWERFIPEMIMCEFDEVKTRNESYDFHSSGELLLSHGYEVYLSEWYPLVRYGANHQWRSLRKYPCDLASDEGWGNFIAIRNDANVETFRRIATPHLSG